MHLRGEYEVHQSQLHSKPVLPPCSSVKQKKVPSGLFMFLKDLKVCIHILLFSHLSHWSCRSILISLLRCSSISFLVRGPVFPARVESSPPQAPTAFSRARASCRSISAICASAWLCSLSCLASSCYCLLGG